jgi:hypothetical protein
MLLRHQLVQKPFFFNNREKERTFHFSTNNHAKPDAKKTHFHLLHRHKFHKKVVFIAEKGHLFFRYFGNSVFTRPLFQKEGFFRK